MLAGLEDVDEGEIRIGGKDMSRIRADIVALQSRLNTTAVYVTHDQAEARTMGDRLALLTAASCGR